jgi:eukaryotic-like serine/threonine-protein kinase
MLGPGDVILGRYALRALIDSGAMAHVFVAEDARLGRQVAVKVLAPELAAVPNAVDRFRREAEAAAALSHPNIVAVYDWGLVDDTAFLVMQYVPGPDLRQVLRQRGPLPERDVLRLGAEVAAALDVAHSHGIVHRDVKPRNVLVAPGGAAVLTDFGIAAPTHGHADADGVYGTALYVSPEQAQGRRVDGRADVYSLGAMLYELLTGEPPFRAETPEETARQHLQAPVRPPRRLRADLSAATERVVMRALQKDPARRFASAAEMRAAMLAAGERRPRALAIRSRRWALAAAPLVALLLIGVPTLARARQASVPALAGQSLETARAAATKAGLTLEVQEQATLDTPAGVIVSQDPQADALAATGSTVHALVSSGVRVPDLGGQQCAAARADLAGAGWTVRPVRWRVANIGDFGKIVAQEPAAGSVVPSKGQITVQVAGPVRPC